MSNTLILKPLAVTVTPTVSSGTGAANLITDDPKEVWIAGSAGAATITLDLGVAQPLDTVFLGFTNLLMGDKVVVQSGNASNLSDGVALETRIVIDPLDITHMVFTGTLRTHRYVRASITTTVTPQAGLMRVGVKFQPTFNREWGSGRAIIDTGSKDPLLGGGFGIGEGTRKSAFRWTFGDLNDDEVDTLYDVAVDRGETRPVVVVEDPAVTVGLGKRIHYGLFDRFEFYERANPRQNRWSLSLQGWGAAPRGGAIGWTPTSVAATAWYDPSDLTTLFQLAGDTTPNVAVGDPVGKMLDKSGNGYHVTQSSSTKRPILRTSGGLYWLEFDGSNDFLSAGDVMDLHTNGYWAVAGVKYVDTSDGAIFAKSLAAPQDGRYSLVRSAADGGLVTVYAAGGVTYIAALVDTSTAARQITVRLSRVAAGSDDLSLTIAGGFAFVSPPADSGTNHDTTRRFLIGANNNADDSGEVLPFKGNFYGLIIKHGATLADSEIAQAGIYLSGKTGGA